MWLPGCNRWNVVFAAFINASLARRTASSAAREELVSKPVAGKGTFSGQLEDVFDQPSAAPPVGPKAQSVRREQTLVPPYASVISFTGARAGDVAHRNAHTLRVHRSSGKSHEPTENVSGVAGFRPENPHLGGTIRLPGAQSVPTKSAQSQSPPSVAETGRTSVSYPAQREDQATHDVRRIGKQRVLPVERLVAGRAKLLADRSETAAASLGADSLGRLGPTSSIFQVAAAEGETSFPTLAGAAAASDAFSVQAQRPPQCSHLPVPEKVLVADKLSSVIDAGTLERRGPQSGSAGESASDTPEGLNRESNATALEIGARAEAGASHALSGHLVSSPSIDASINVRDAVDEQAGRHGSADGRNAEFLPSRLSGGEPPSGKLSAGLLAFQLSGPTESFLIDLRSRDFLTSQQRLNADLRGPDRMARLNLEGDSSAGMIDSDCIPEATVRAFGVSVETVGSDALFERPDPLLSIDAAISVPAAFDGQVLGSVWVDERNKQFSHDGLLSGGPPFGGTSVGGGGLQPSQLTEAGLDHLVLPAGVTLHQFLRADLRPSWREATVINHPELESTPVAGMIDSDRLAERSVAEGALANGYKTWQDLAPSIALQIGEIQKAITRETPSGVLTNVDLFKSVSENEVDVSPVVESQDLVEGSSKSPVPSEAEAPQSYVLGGRYSQNPSPEAQRNAPAFLNAVNGSGGILHEAKPDRSALSSGVGRIFEASADGVEFQPAPSRVQALSIRIGVPSAPPVQLRFIENAGGLRIVFSSTDATVIEGMSRNLPELSEQLQALGLQPAPDTAGGLLSHDVNGWGEMASDHSPDGEAESQRQQHPPDGGSSQEHNRRRVVSFATLFQTEETQNVHS